MRTFESQAEVDEFVNEIRDSHGLTPLPAFYHVTQIREGMTAGCGCAVTTVTPGSHFTIYHHDDCYLAHQRTPHREVVECHGDQAVCSTQDERTNAVMRLDLPWPHEIDGYGHIATGAGGSNGKE